MDSAVVILIIAIVAIGALLFLVIHFFPHSPSVDKQKYQSRWLEIEQKLQLSSVDSKHMAIMNADKLLDQALRETGSHGKTMGERMKARQGVWSNANAVWAAHKLRNRIAHEESVSVSDDMAGRALASFRQALKDLGAL